MIFRPALLGDFIVERMHVDKRKEIVDICKKWFILNKDCMLTVL
jgi:hypothetical protein